VAASRRELPLLVGAGRAVDFEVDRRAGARFVVVLLADDLFAEARFADLDLGGLA
jgi:hypothetical protein